ncbi:hypothetical protein LJD48_28525, partial [Escherichia coli]|nr:hypothetical protein [Escherichia coli]
MGNLAPVQSNETGDAEALWRRLRSDGYLYLKGFLPVHDVLDFRSYYFEALAETGLHRPGTEPE